MTAPIGRENLIEAPGQGRMPRASHVQFAWMSGADVERATTDW